jgi:hypothetical protein
LELFDKVLALLLWSLAGKVNLAVGGGLLTLLAGGKEKGAAAGGGLLTLLAGGKVKRGLFAGGMEKEAVAEGGLLVLLAGGKEKGRGGVLPSGSGLAGTAKVTLFADGIVGVGGSALVVGACETEEPKVEEGAVELDELPNKE